MCMCLCVCVCVCVCVCTCIYVSIKILCSQLLSGLHSTVSDASDCRSRGHNCESLLDHISFMEIDHEIISMVILPLPLIQEGQLSVTGRSMYTKYWAQLSKTSLANKLVSGQTVNCSSKYNI